MRRHFSKLDESSFTLHSHVPILSQQSLHSTSPSDDEVMKTFQHKDIFQAKTPAEISENYHKILMTYGKWNAATYINIFKELNAEDKAAIQQVEKLFPSQDLISKERVDINKTASRLKNKSEVQRKFKNIVDDCKLHAIKPQKLYHFKEDSKYPTLEPTYKKIFKNAKLKRKPKVIDSTVDKSTPRTPPQNVEESVSVDPSEGNKQLPKKCCDLERDGHNNYLVDLRVRKIDKDRKKVSFGSSNEFHLDNIERFYVNHRIRSVLENNLQEQMELMKASLKSPVTDVSEIDLLIERGYQELKGKYLDNFESIQKFQNMFDDERWRKKYDLSLIENSDDANSLDVSDVASSESASMCSGDSLGTELDYRSKPVLPSRIPCIAEVREKCDILFDKISRKWEKAIKKNFLDPNLIPFYRHYSHLVRLRSTAPIYSEMIKLLERYDAVHKKKFTPNKYRTVEGLAKMEAAQKANDDLAKERRDFESVQILKGLGKRPSTPARIIAQEPTKYLDKNQRQRLDGIIKETKHRGQEGLTNWSQQALIDDYVNLKPIIQAKGPPKTIKTESTTTLALQKRRRFPKVESVRSLWNYETSLFLRVRKPKKSLSSTSKNRLLAGSRSRLRMPI